jgi:HEPN domain-containing protein
MTPSQWPLEDARAWVRHAEKDLRLARLCSAEFLAEALFHWQQAAEKYRKAYLTWRQAPFRKTHELRDLATACIGIDESLEPVRDSSEALSQYA